MIAAVTSGFGQINDDTGYGQQNKPGKWTPKTQSSVSLERQKKKNRQASGADCEKLLPEVINNPPAPKPEPIVVSELPLPPTVGTANPHGTGFIDSSDRAIEEGPSYMWDGKHVLLTVTFAGAPAAPDPSGIYSGTQVIIIKTDGTTFSNGDPWKCITCGVPDRNSEGMHLPADMRIGNNNILDHPQAFHDGKRIIAGNNVIECQYPLASDSCTPANTYIYPIRWNITDDGSGMGGNMREIRLNPDDIHMGWNYLGLVGGSFTEIACLGRLEFNPAPKEGLPLIPRYDLKNVYVLMNKTPDHFFKVNPDNPNEIIHTKPKYVIGEFRGFTSDGLETLGIYMEESGNWDGYATSLATGESRRITRDPAYTDPMKTSPDDKWTIVMDSRGYDRMMWLSGMRGVPPLTDLLTIMVSTGLRNNGNRRFFQPYLIDRFGDRGSYHGQQLNSGDGTPGSVSDPNWNGRADPTWSPDGTKVIYWQALVTSPDCGGSNPLPCPVSTEPGGRRVRLMMASLTSRKPMPVRVIPPIPDDVPWGIPFTSLNSLPAMAGNFPAPGTYTLKGKVSGSAAVVLKAASGGMGLSSVSVMYTDFTDDGLRIINGTESAETTGGGMMGGVIIHSNLTSSGCQTGTKITSEPGGFKVEGGFMGGGTITGTLTTTIGGRPYTSPETGR